MTSTLENLAQLFARMQAGGFDTALPLKWCFYFTDESPEKLRALHRRLIADGHTLESLDQPEGGTPWTLFISKSGVFSAETLHDQNLAFNALATDHEVASYDGWGVEKTTLF